MDIFQSSPNKDFSDDSLMVNNESIDPSITTGPALTDAGLEESPYTTQILNEGSEPRMEEQPVSTQQQESNNEPESTNQRSTTPVSKVAAGPLALDGDDGSSGNNISNNRHAGQSPALLEAEAEAYADNLARGILNDTKSVLKETVIDEGNSEALSQVELQQEGTNIIPTDAESVIDPKPAMEFAKNYSDDLLMGQSDGGQAQGESQHTTNADLADFELPPYSGSSSGSSEPAARQQSPTITTSTINKAQSSTPSTSSSQSAGLSTPNFTALRDLLKSNYSRVSHIFHWKKPIESGVCFAIGATLIIALTFFSIISVVAYSTLGLMVASGSIRAYKTVMKTLNRSTDTPVDHIWNKVQALNVSMSHEKMHELVDTSLGNLNASLKYFKQVLLVEDKVAALKFGSFVYFLTYIGAWFNGMTLITIGYLGLFSVPIMYEKNKTKIDELLNLATGHLCSATSMITNKVGSLVSGSSASAVKKQD